MKKDKFQFKTNINCGGCIATVKPFLDQAAGADRWAVDTTNRDKVLTVESGEITEDQVVAVVQKAGFRIEPLKS